MEIVGLERDDPTSWLAATLRAAVAVHGCAPVMRGVRIVRSWCGIEARTPDEIPVIGESTTCTGLIHSFGYSGHGFQLAPAAGAAVAEIMMRGGTNLPVAAFAPARLVEQAAA